MRWSELSTVRDSLTILIEFFLEHQSALKAVGLEE